MQMLINQYIQEVLRYVPMVQRQELEAMTTFTLVTLVFFMLSKEGMTEMMHKEWTIDQLPKGIDLRDRIPLSVGISSFIGYLITFIWLGAIQEIFTEVFRMEHSGRVIELLAIGLLVGMVLSIYQMLTKAWTKKTRLMDIGIFPEQDSYDRMNTIEKMKYMIKEWKFKQ